MGEGKGLPKARGFPLSANVGLMPLVRWVVVGCCLFCCAYQQRD